MTFRSNELPLTHGRPRSKVTPLDIQIQCGFSAWRACNGLVRRDLPDAGVHVGGSAGARGQPKGLAPGQPDEQPGCQREHGDQCRQRQGMAGMAATGVLDETGTRLAPFRYRYVLPAGAPNHLLFSQQVRRCGAWGKRVGECRARGAAGGAGLGGAGRP
jgi:hypothetical protein